MPRHMKSLLKTLKLFFYLLLLNLFFQKNNDFFESIYWNSKISFQFIPQKKKKKMKNSCFFKKSFLFIVNPFFSLSKSLIIDFIWPSLFLFFRIFFRISSSPFFQKYLTKSNKLYSVFKKAHTKR